LCETKAGETEMKYNFINQDGLIYLGQVLFKYEGTKKAVVIPEGITRIHHAAFMGTDITSVSFPNTLESVGCQVFRECKNLKEVIFPESVKRIGSDVFYGCMLEKVVFPRELDELFDNRQVMKEVVLPERVHDFSSTFSGSELDRISITPVLDRRKYNTFPFVWESVRTPNGTTKLPKYFLAATNVRKVVIGGNFEHIPLKTCANNFYLEEVVLEEGVKSLASTAFDFSYFPVFQDGESKKVEITLPTSVEKIDTNFMRITKNSERKILLKVPVNSYSHQFALDNDFEFQLI
jgi:hypothetical protein